MGKSRSQTASTTTQTSSTVQDIDTTTVGLEDLDVEEGGVVAAAGRDVSIISTDQGAVEAGRAIGERALDTVGETSAGAFDFGGETVDDAFTFGTRALEAVERVAQQSQGASAGVIGEAGKASQIAAGTPSKIGLYIAGAFAIGATAFVLSKR